MRSEHIEKLEREDLVMFINACFACSGQKEFYGDARGQRVSIGFLHEYILGNYRRLYARSLAAGINHFNQSQVILNLLATGKATSVQAREEEGALLYAALSALPPQRVYKLFTELRTRKINNRRTRAIARRYLAERRDLPFEALKYRKKLAAVASHAHLELPGELGRFVFSNRRDGLPFETPLFERFRQAHFSKQAMYDLPYTIAEGLAGKHGVARDQFLEGIEARMTAGEKLRLERSAQRDEVTLDIDLSRMGLTRACVYLLAVPVAERLARRAAIAAALETSALRALRRAPKRLGRVAAVLDRSYSSAGSSEKRRRPLAVAWAASELLRAASRDYRAFWTPPLEDEIALAAHGQTDLATPLLRALEWGAELVVIVSDGFENDPPRGAAEVARVFRKRIDPEHRVSIVHMNPVFDAEHFAPRALGPALPTVGLRDAEDLLTMLGFARFAEGSAPLAELEDYLAERMKALLHAAPVTR